MQKLLVSLVGLLLFSCSGPKVVSTEVADNIKWSNFKTFDFYNTEASGDTGAGRFASSIALLKQTITAELQEKGLRQKSSAPDLLVNLGVVVKEKVQTRETNFANDAPKYIGQRRYSWKSQEVEVGRYREGTLSMDIVDPRENMLIWKGVVESIVLNNDNKLQKSIQEGVTKLLQNFPRPLRR